MHCCVPEFVLEEDDSIFPSSFVRKIPDSTTEDFVERLWQKGPVFGRRSPHSESAVLPSRTDPSASGLTSYSGATPVAATELFMEEDEMASWLDYPLGEDDSGGGTVGVGGDYLPVKTSAALDCVFHVPTAERRGEVGARAASGRPPLPPETQGKLALFPRTREAAGESTVVGSSLTPGLLARGRTPESRVSPGGGSGGTGSVEHGLTSSSGVMCEGEGAAKAAARPDDRKRKTREGDDSDSQSEDAEFQCSDRKEDAKRSTSKRRSRAAEVHNRSERRRRDRINEKMKALQQLIPRCNKSDKASMLDDAIEYLKSLQMQVQMMSMCCNMFPMMFPGIQQYMPPMGLGIPMGMSMGMGLGVGMEMSAGTLNHSMMPFLPVMPSSHMFPTGAAPLSQRLPMQPFHAQAFALSDQMKLQATTSQTDPASNLACPAASSPAQIPNNRDPVHQYAGFHLSQGYLQNQASTEQGTSKGVNMPEKSKTGLNVGQGDA